MNPLGNLFDPGAAATCAAEYERAAEVAYAEVRRCNREDRDATDARRVHEAAEHRALVASRLAQFAAYSAVPGANPGAEAHAAWVLESVAAASSYGHALHRLHAHHCRVPPKAYRAALVAALEV